MIRRPPISTQSRSSAASDVYKRQGEGARVGELFAVRLDLELGDRFEGFPVAFRHVEYEALFLKRISGFDVPGIADYLISVAVFDRDPQLSTSAFLVPGRERNIERKALVEWDLFQVEFLAVLARKSDRLYFGNRLSG